jgi:nucleoside-diphosphate-sugar epimerase
MDRHLAEAADDVIEDLGVESQRLAGKTMLLTGAAGFVGAHFVHYCLRLNDAGVLRAPCRLIAVDNFLRGTPAWLERLRDRADLEILRHDIVEPLQARPCEFVVHAASVASPVYYRRHPIETMDANVTGLRLLLDRAVRERDTLESFLYFSSSEIYGDPDPANIPTREDYRGFVSCTGPRACYDESKRFGETLCVNFHKVHRVPVKVARPFNNYGPGLKISDRRVLPDFFRDALSDRDIVMWSDGRATRTFCYITDAMTGYLKILFSGADGEAFNIGTEAPEISMLDLSARVARVTGRKVKVVTRVSEDRDYLKDSPGRRCPSIEKARTLLRYHPRVDLDTGLAKTFRYYVDHPMAEDL